MNKNKFIKVEGAMMYKGISDLKSIYAFHGNSQGDETQTNNVSDYISSKGWLSVSFHFKDINYLNQDEVNKRSKELDKENQKYIRALKKSGEYGKKIGRPILLPD